MIQILLMLGLVGPVRLAPDRSHDTRSGGPEPAFDELLNEESIQEVVHKLAREVEDIRGQRFLCLPSVRLDNRANILERARQAVTERMRPESQEVEGFCAKLLGMLPGDVDLQQLRNELWSSQYDGFFDHDCCVFYIAREIDTASARLQIVYGLAQILDEQHHDLIATRERLRGNGDARLAATAVALGSAAAVQEAWKLRNAGRLTSRERRQGSHIFDLSELGHFPPYIWKPLLIAATRGPTFLQRSGVLSLMLPGVRTRDIDRALADLPTSTEQVLHPVKYWKRSRADAPRRVEIDLEGLPEGWQLLREDTLGELRLGIMLEAAGVVDQTGADSELDAALTHVPSEGWGGDRHVLLRRGDATLLYLATVWDEPSDALEFHHAMRAAMPHLSDNLARIPATAAAQERGVAVEFGPVSDQVLLISWIGMSESQACELVSRIRLGVGS